MAEDIKKTVAIDLDFSDARRKHTEFISEMRRDIDSLRSKELNDLEKHWKMRKQLHQQQMNQEMTGEEKSSRGKTQKETILDRESKSRDKRRIQEQLALEQRLFQLRKTNSDQLFQQELEKQKKIYEEIAKKDKTRLDQERQNLMKMKVMAQEVFTAEAAAATTPGQKTEARAKLTQTESQISQLTQATKEAGEKSGKSSGAAMLRGLPGVFRALGFSGFFFSAVELLGKIADTNKEILQVQRNAMQFGGAAAAGPQAMAGMIASLFEQRAKADKIGLDEDSINRLSIRLSETTLFKPEQLPAMAFQIMQSSFGFQVPETVITDLVERLQKEFNVSFEDMPAQMARIISLARGTGVPLGQAVPGIMDINRQTRMFGGGTGGAAAGLGALQGVIRRGEISPADVGQTMATLMSKLNQRGNEVTESLMALNRASRDSIFTFKEMRDSALQVAEQNARYGMALPESIKLVKSWDRELRLNIISINDLTESQRRRAPGVGGALLGGALAMQDPNLRRLFQDMKIQNPMQAATLINEVMTEGLPPELEKGRFLGIQGTGLSRKEATSAFRAQLQKANLIGEGDESMSPRQAIRTAIMNASGALAGGEDAFRMMLPGMDIAAMVQAETGAIAGNAASRAELARQRRMGGGGFRGVTEAVPGRRVAGLPGKDEMTKWEEESKKILADTQSELERNTGWTQKVAANTKIGFIDLITTFKTAFLPDEEKVVQRLKINRRVLAGEEQIAGPLGGTQTQNLFARVLQDAATGKQRLQIPVGAEPGRVRGIVEAAAGRFPGLTVFVEGFEKQAEILQGPRKFDNLEVFKQAQEDLIKKLIELSSGRPVSRVVPTGG